MSTVSTIWLLCCWLPIPLWLTLRNSARFKKNIVVGVTLPHEAHDDEQVVAILSGYRRQQLVCAIVLMSVALASAAAGSVRAFAEPLMVGWTVWILTSCIVPEVIFARTNARLTTLKREHGWRGGGKNGSRHVTIADINAAAQPQIHISNVWFLLTVTASMVPTLFDRRSLPVYILFTASILATWAIFRWCCRDRSEVVDDNEILTQALTRIRRRAWDRMSRVTTAAFALMSWSQLLFQGSPTLHFVSMTLPAAALVIASFTVEMRVRDLQERLTKSSGKGFYVDEDDHWIFGIFYCNPDDSNLMVNDRVGINTSVNLAHPAGKAIAAVLALILLCLPMAGVFIANELTTPVTFELSEQMIHASHTLTNYKFAVNDVESVEMLDQLPKMTRTFGSATDTFLGGDFSSEKYGSLKVCLNPETGPWLLIRTKDGTTYLLGASNPSQASSIYEKLIASRR